MVARRGSPGPDPVALVEIDLYGELMIAAASADEDRLSPDRIDEVLRVEADRSAGRSADRSADRTAERSDSANRSTGRTTENAERPETDGPDAG
ncbi:hypothetical protein EEJ42_43705 [Streptomyces botrytidirepellens]|uniref:Uncharacterized protein n=1 Tax=Streptomyces botrytidirepellens TaxID=2486417 RepID=A0A3M8T475_9ACTN|nr:hypothetical protein EEJ42_43705 [Streptomyces botrytidirepellens]